MVYCVSSNSELQSDHYYEYAEYENDNDDDDDEVEPGQMGGGVMNSDY